MTSSDREIDLLAKALPARLGQYARELYGVSVLTQVDPLLIAALMDRETLGGTSHFLDKSGPGGRGDGGHGHGLIQIDDRFHPSFLAAHDEAGRPLWTLPMFNLLYGIATIFAVDLARFAGSEPAAVAAYNAGWSHVRNALASMTLPGNDADVVALVDPLTSGHDYARDVLARRANLRDAYQQAQQEQG